MDKNLSYSGSYQTVITGLIIVSALYLTSVNNYLLFHSISEIFSVVIACGIFIVAWNSRKIAKNDYLLLLGIAYLFIALLDFLHTLAYPGMGVFQGNNLNTPVQLWIAARYTESITLFIAPLILRRNLNIRLTVSSYTAATLLFIMSIFYWDIFPACFIEGKGLTTFKKSSEYVISLILLASIFMLTARKKEFDKNVFKLIIASISFTIMSEFAFTFYISFFGLSNLAGHIFKGISFYLLYKAIIENSLMNPYNLLFRKLSESKEMWRSLSESSPDHIFMLDTDLKIQYANYASPGMATAYLLETPLYNYAPEEKQNEVKGILEDVLHTSKNARYETTQITPKGRTIHYESRATPRIISGNVVGLTVAARDITDRKRVEEELLRHREHLMDLVEERTHELKTSYQKLEEEFAVRKTTEKKIRLMALFAELNPAPVLSINTIGEVTMANAAAIEILNIAPHATVSLSSILPGPNTLDIQECIRSSTTHTLSTKIKDRYYHFIIRGVSELGMGHIYGTDITDQKKAEAEIVRASQLALTGELAAGVAHEVNNPINGIINYSQILANRSSTESEEYRIALLIIKESNRIANIVKELLAFTRTNNEDKRPVHIREIMNDSFGLIKTHLENNGTTLKVNIPSSLPMVLANPQHLEQVFLNIINNAGYALNQKYAFSNNNKVLEISAEEIVTDNNHYVLITFHDKGTGISKELLNNITEPFFTTKPGGKGTGLGLSISKSIILDLGGALSIESTEGEFTRVRIKLPAATQHNENKPGTNLHDFSKGPK